MDKFPCFLGQMLTLNLLPVHELVPQVITALLLWCQVLNLGCLSSSLWYQLYSCIEQNNKSLLFSNSSNQMVVL